MSREALRLIRRGQVKKGDPLQAARLAGIMGAKQKPLDRPTPADLGVEGLGAASARQKITAVEPAPERAAGEIIQDDGEAAKRIVEFLSDKKVI